MIIIICVHWLFIYVALYSLSGIEEKNIYKNNHNHQWALYRRMFALYYYNLILILW